MGLSAVGIFIVYLHILGNHVLHKFHRTAPVLHTADIAPVASVEIGEVERAHRLTLIAEHKVNVGPVVARNRHTQVLHYVGQPLGQPRERIYFLACVLVRASHIGWPLHRLQQGVSPVIIPQGIVNLASLLGHLAQADVFLYGAYASFKYLVQFAPFDVASDMGFIGTVVYHHALGVGQRGGGVSLQLRVGVARSVELPVHRPLVFRYAEVIAHHHRYLAYQCGEGLLVSFLHGRSPALARQIGLGVALHLIPALRESRDEAQRG